MNVSRDTPPDQAKLRRYQALVRLWAPRTDLVAPGDLAHFWTRHIEDSLRLVPLLDRLPEGPGVDVGSGAGLPGIPLAIARPERHWRLLEPRHRRAAFLEEAVRELELDCRVVTLTAEQAARDPHYAQGHVIATARAVAHPSEGIGLLLPLLCLVGVGAIYLGHGAEVPPEAEEWAEGIAIIRASPQPPHGRTFQR